MFRRITKSRLFVAILALAVAIPATATATHIFVDVPDAKFYADATEWAKNNNITTGSPAGADTFKPEDPVTRGESVTFLKRFDDNIVQPGLADVQADADAAQADADAAQADADANTAAIEANDADIANLPDVYFIEVDADGTKLQGSFGTSSSNSATGRYNLVFPVDDTADCTWSATVAQKRGSIIDPVAPDDGIVSLRTDFDFNGLIFVRDVDSIDVLTRNDAGFDANMPFHVQITCGLPTGIFIPPILPIFPIFP